MCDENCVIEVGEHPYVAKKTVIAYEKARIITSSQQAQVERLAKPHKPVSDALLDKIQRGACVSDLTPQKVIKAIQDSMAKQIKS